MVNLITILSTVLMQIQTNGLERVSEQGTIFAFLITILVIISGVLVFLYFRLENKNKEVIKLQTIHAENINNIQNSYNNSLKSHQENHLKDLKATQENHIRDLKITQENYVRELKEILNKNNELWQETEKEILNVLNGVSSIIELNEKIAQASNQNIIDRLKDIYIKVNEK